MGSSIELIQGDITNLEVDAIVNAANSSLMGGGGVDGAIHRAGGPVILHECKLIVARQGRCKTGEAVITTAGNMPAKHVIHAVGPVWRGGNNNEEQMLADAYRNSLQIASDHNIGSIAFPNISTGVYGFPKEKAAEIAIRTVQEFMAANQRIKKVLFICFDEENFTVYERLFAVRR